MKPGCGGVTRCRWPAMKEAGALPLDAAAFKEIIDRAPEECPHNDCSPGGCRAQVADVLRAVWSTRKRLDGVAWQKKQARMSR